jgi:hypothetical protein
MDEVRTELDQPYGSSGSGRPPQRTRRSSGRTAGRLAPTLSGDGPLLMSIKAAPRVLSPSHSLSHSRFGSFECGCLADPQSQLRRQPRAAVVLVLPWLITNHGS